MKSRNVLYIVGVLVWMVSLTYQLSKDNLTFGEFVISTLLVLILATLQDFQKAIEK